MKEIIDRNWIRSDVQWYQYNTERTERLTFTHKDIAEATDHWKNIIVENSEWKPGARLAAGIHTCDIRYLSLLIATIELGGELIVTDKPATLEQIDQIRCRVLAPFDLFVLDDHNPDPKVLLTAEVYAKKAIYMQLWHDYVSPTCQYSNVEWATPDGFMLAATSSGSTGTPKPIEWSHEFLYNLGKRASRLFDLKPEDRVLHLGSLHHGGSSGFFFFPSLNACKHHFFEYGLEGKGIPAIIEMIKKEKITKIIWPNNLLLEQFISTTPPLEHDLDLYCLQANLKTWIPMVKRSNVRSVTSIFGASEVLSPIFVNVITRDSPDDHNVLNYGKLLDDFFEVELTNDQRFKVSNCYRGTYILNDHFELDADGNYHYVKRTDLMRINEVTLTFDECETISKKYFGINKGYLVPDTLTNKIYLLADEEFKSVIDEKLPLINQDLANINSILKVDFVDCLPIIKFYDQIKFSYVWGKAHFREKHQLV
jgi:hypothetical protein